jgi:hypothetical protein
VFSPDNNHEGRIDSAIGGGGPIDPQSLCGNGNKDNNNNYAQCKACIGHDDLSLISYNSKCFVYSLKEGGGTIVVCFKSVVGSWEKEANWILKILVKIQWADQGRFDKQKRTYWTSEYPPVTIFPFLWYIRHFPEPSVEIQFHS